MTEITLIANAKLNLYLDITGRRADGYHLIESVMQSVDLSDIVTIKRGGADIRVSCSDPSIPENEGNICYKAAAVFFKEIEEIIENSGVDIRIEKRIPHGAGLGGGSADAAAVLIGLNRLYGGVVSGEQIPEIGAAIGADVPFCMTGGVKLCKGIGEELHDTEPLPERVYLVVMPDFQCDTRGAYQRFDEAPLPRNGGLEDFLSSGEAFPQKLYNVFQRLYKDERIDAITKRLSELGAEGACLSGSGAAVFGVFADNGSAMNAAKAFPEFFTAVCKPVSRGIIIV
ncbi:MAG: 4-(cytidine 5'-diphospho)-2-C-methyl-D-erythritol kinase [Oscillospiraceae bacterium]|nr:4-(cytidine 5'-diphospho)-2-C-methyl-D-erythritol kinase [Oscillospiraceae bacterium]